MIAAKVRTGEQVEDPAGELLPALHCVHEPVPPALMVPARHSGQASALPDSENEPAGHFEEPQTTAVS
jgi:hypothetical protein